MGITVRREQQMVGACRLFSGAHMSFSALLVHSDVSLGVSGPVCLPLHRFSPFLESPSALPSPSLDVASSVR